MNHPRIVGDAGSIVCIADNGYSELNYLPDNENWQLYAIYNNHGDIIEWYFDISRKNSVDENGNPYCDDMYLDLALMPDGRILIFDEDELRSAYENGGITTDEYNMAYRVKDELMERGIIDITYMGDFCAKLLSLFKD